MNYGSICTSWTTYTWMKSVNTGVIEVISPSFQIDWSDGPLLKIDEVDFYNTELIYPKVVLVMITVPV